MRALGIALLVCACGAAHAQGYPAHPPRLIVPFPAGGPTDLIGRALAKKLGDGLGQQLIVENRAGAGGTIGLVALARSAADGYSLGLGTVSTLGMAPVVRANPPYDSLAAFAPVSLVASAPFIVVVNASVPAKSLAELIALARAKPGQYNFGSIGDGTLQHFAGESFKSLAKVDIVHVPYKGVAPMLVDLLAGQVQIGFDILASFQVQNIQAGRLRALAVLGPTRVSRLPSVPTAAEAGLPGMDVTAWFGLIAPKGTPAEIVARLNAEVRKAVASAELREAIATQGLEPAADSPQEFAEFIEREMARWAQVVKTSGFRVE
ncbi:MAG TPA: tripartite tricarboxylate transporter substrate binding protein [Burkholderiales bacterium]|nr:tripartite tricarboxylate transporter substrate binding protein [Burkholderiales bacterium]